MNCLDYDTAAGRGRASKPSSVPPSPLSRVEGRRCRDPISGNRLPANLISLDKDAGY